MASPSSPFADLSSTLADMVAAASPHAVEVQSHRALASGFFWRKGLVVTPDETLAEDGRIEVELADGTVLEAGPDPPLTPRERVVIALLAEGLSNKAIAGRLGISPATAKFHVGRVIDKLDAIGRTDAVAHAARRGIIHL